MIYPDCNRTAAYDSYFKAKIFRHCGWNEQVKPTNADRIRSMTDEELAELILECHHAGYADDTITGDHNVDIMDWLQQPVEVANSD